MKSQKTKLSKKNGFSILAVILVIVAVIVAIGVWALSGSTNSNNSSDSVSSVAVTSLVNDSASIKLGFDTLIINGESMANIAFQPNNNATNNILNTNTGIALPVLNPKLFVDGASEPSNQWVYAKQFYITSRPSYAILAVGVKDSYCSKINQTYNGTTDIPRSSGYSSAQQFVADASKAIPMSNQVVDFQSQSLSAAATWQIGCVGSSQTDSNIFFKVLKTY